MWWLEPGTSDALKHDQLAFLFPTVDPESKATILHGTVGKMLVNSEASLSVLLPSSRLDSDSSSEDSMYGMLASSSSEFLVSFSGWMASFWIGVGAIGGVGRDRMVSSTVFATGCHELGVKSWSRAWRERHGRELASAGEQLDCFCVREVADIKRRGVLGGA
jgi:hypothetical protein